MERTRKKKKKIDASASSHFDDVKLRIEDVSSLVVSLTDDVL